jgi:hypothetical protein
MNRLYSDQLQGSGRRYYFALDSAPGIVTPATAVLSMVGRIPAAAEPTTVFRSPDPAVLTLSGLQVRSPSLLSPATAALAYIGNVPVEVRSLTITPALPPPIENPPDAFVPTLITIWHAQPATAMLTLQALEQNVTEGGNIGFVSPAPAQLTLSTLEYTILFGEAGAGTLTVVGLVPEILTEFTISPDPAMLAFGQLEPSIHIPFQWIDDAPAPAATWITDAAA